MPSTKEHEVSGHMVTTSRGPVGIATALEVRLAGTSFFITSAKGLVLAEHLRSARQAPPLPRTPPGRP
jgi:hypothetical protein